MARTKPTFYPEVGEKVTLKGHTGNYWIDMVCDPYTVVAVSEKERCVYIQSCKLTFDGPRYYDTIASKIENDPDGTIIKLTFVNNKRNRNRWVHKYDAYDEYPRIAIFGIWKHQPYLD